MCNNENNPNYMIETLEKILLLQQIDNNLSIGCEKPFLGNIPPLANTRPINLYSCCNGTIWTMPYNNNGITGNSSTFRIESICDNCATFRILIPQENNYVATNEFFIIDLNCICSIKCLNDSLINNL